MAATRTRRATAVSDRRGSVAAILRTVDAPDWAAANLDALADVLRDLSWLDAGPVLLRWAVPPELPAPERQAIARVLLAAARESQGSARPLRVQFQPLP